jgi:hypothetical protein
MAEVLRRRGVGFIRSDNGMQRNPSSRGGRSVGQPNIMKNSSNYSTAKCKFNFINLQNSKTLVKFFPLVNTLFPLPEPPKPSLPSDQSNILNLKACMF